MYSTLRTPPKNKTHFRTNFAQDLFQPFLDSVEHRSHPQEQPEIVEDVKEDEKPSETSNKEKYGEEDNQSISSCETDESESQSEGEEEKETQNRSFLWKKKYESYSNPFRKGADCGNLLVTSHRTPPRV